MGNAETNMIIECYFDDSYDENGVPVVTMAGYVGTKESWSDFESDCNPLFGSFGVAVFHAMDFHRNRGEFKGWTVTKKQEFLARWFDLVKVRAGFGISKSVIKQTFENRRPQTGLSKSQSAYGFCFDMVLNELLEHENIRYATENLGAMISLKVEDGNKNNSGVLDSYNEIRKKYGLEDRLSGIEFVAKNSCRAIQVADALAYYSRRHAQASEENNRQPVSYDQYLKIMLERVAHSCRVATDFFADERSP
jgi:hypothetical protein